MQARRQTISERNGSEAQNLMPCRLTQLRERKKGWAAQFAPPKIEKAQPRKAVPKEFPVSVRTAAAPSTAERAPAVANHPTVVAECSAAAWIRASWSPLAGTILPLCVRVRSQLLPECVGDRCPWTW